MTVTLTCLSGCFWSGAFYQDHQWGYIQPSTYSNFYSSSYTPAANNEGSGVDGWNFISTAPDPSRNLGYGIYKVTNDRNDFYFYINYFDQNYGSYNTNQISCTGGHPVDLWLKYDGHPNAVMFQYSNQPVTCQWTDIQRGQLLNIWNMKGGTNITPQISIFYDFSSYCLALINNGQNHPELVWGLYPFGTSDANYIIWKSYNNSDFYEYNYKSGSQTSFPDLSESLNIGSSPTVSYVLSDNGQTAFTNIVGSAVVAHIGQGGSGKIKTKYNFISKPKIFELSQNYPNPFNPTSTITFTLPNSEFTQLKVYDIFGREINTLVKGFLTAGVHSIEFNAKNLASGVYFYTLKAGNYSSTKKMILTK